MKKILQLLFILVLAGSASPSLSLPLSDSRYDHQIEAAAEKWLPTVDWRLLKAQYYQESLLNSRAVSPVGAKGIAQFMPGTWKEVSRQMGLRAASPFMADAAIEAGAFYMARLRRGWTARRPETDRIKLAQASYNAGFGNILKSQKRCHNARLFDDIMACLHHITGNHSRETKTYVRRIWHYYRQLVAGGS